MVQTVKTFNDMKADIKRLKLTNVTIESINRLWHLRATQGTIGHNFSGKDLGNVWGAMVRCLEPKNKE